MSTALRTSLIWHDEVMADLVHEKPATVTLGASSDATFVTPELALPPSFAIVTPGRRGYVLTLSAQMSGTICLGGVEHDVAAFVAAGDEPASGFRGTLLGPDDWGVITLDDRGDHKFFFQFVPHEVEDWNLGHPMILAGVAGYALSVAALTAFWWHDGVALGEAAFRGGSLASLAIGLAAIVRWAFKQDNDSRASLAFSVLLHTAVLFLTFQLYEKADPNIWPGPKALTGEYLVALREPAPPPPEKKKVEQTPTVGVAKALPPTMAVDRSNRIPPSTTPWKFKAKPTLPQKAKDKGGKPGPGVLVRTDILVALTGDRGIKTIVDDFQKIGDDGVGGEPGEVGAGGLGPTRGGDPDGDRHGGGPVGKHSAKKGALDTGPMRDAVVCVGDGCKGGGGTPFGITPRGGGEDSGPTLSKEEIMTVMVKNQGKFKACYQKALDRSGAISGGLVVHFVIDADGKVTETRTVSSSIGGDVPSCVKGMLQRLHFPAKGGAKVNFPFSFTSGG
jgi:hypothetical protein